MSSRDFRYHLARYEDFARWPLEEFEKAYKFMGLPLTQALGGKLFFYVSKCHWDF